MYSGIGVVLDCIDFLSLPFFLLSIVQAVTMWCFEIYAITNSVSQGYENF